MLQSVSATTPPKSLLAAYEMRSVSTPTPVQGNCGSAPKVLSLVDISDAQSHVMGSLLSCALPLFQHLWGSSTRWLVSLLPRLDNDIINCLPSLSQAWQRKRNSTGRYYLAVLERRGLKCRCELVCFPRPENLPLTCVFLTFWWLWTIFPLVYVCDWFLERNRVTTVGDLAPSLIKYSIILM